MTELIDCAPGMQIQADTRAHSLNHCAVCRIYDSDTWAMVMFAQRLNNRDI